MLEQQIIITMLALRQCAASRGNRIGEEANVSIFYHYFLS